MKYQRMYMAFLLFFGMGITMNAQAAEVGPHWVVGDAWTVETQTVQTPSSSANTSGTPVEWNFTVAAEEPTASKDCFRVEITCADTSRPQPNATIWIDRETGMLVRLTSRIPVGNAYSEYSETYQMTENTPTPVLGIIPSLPLDMPIFGEIVTHRKSLEPMCYISSGDNGAKGLNGPRFAYEVRQTMEAVPAAQMKSLGGAAENGKQNVNVKINVGTQSVEQVWTEGKPWPVYSSNGASTSRLKAFRPAKQAPSSTQEAK